MSDIFASPAAGTARPAAGSTSGQSVGGETAVRVVDPSPELARLASGDSLRGTVVGRDDHGHLQVRTRLGVLTLTLPRALPVGTEVVLQVRSIGAQVILNLLPLDSAAAGGSAGVQPGQAPQAPGGTTAPAPLPANPSDLVQRGQLLRAVLHAAPPLPALAGLPTTQPGTELLARILSLGVQPPAPGGTLPPPLVAVGATPPLVAAGASPPAGGTAASGPAIAPAAVPGAGLVPAPGSGPQATPGATAPAGGPPSPPGLLPQAAAGGAAVAAGAVALPEASATLPGLRLAPQTPVTASGHSLAAALQGASTEAAAKALGSPAAAAAGAAAAPGEAPGAAAGTVRLTGLVTATTNGGQPIVHTPLGTLTLDTRAVLPPGTSLALEIVLPPAGAAAVPGLTAWPSLESLEATLFHGLPAGHAEAVARALPQVGPRLASGVLFFLAALNQGNVAGWLAQAGGAAERGERGELPGGLAERLGREIAGLARSVETAAGEWRFVNLPLWSDEGLRELRCFFRHQEHGGRRDGDGDKATRFVLELDLKRHGALQLDGLVRARLFDLVLRSRRPLPALVRGDLLALFEETNAIAGYSGRLVFQASQDWLQLLAARGATQPHDGFRV